MTESPLFINRMGGTLQRNLLLSTKLQAPHSRAALVSRPKLIARLDHGVHKKLTLISAPTGSGKTTLLGEWTRSQPSNRSCAWFSLDKADNDPTRFLTYLIAALQTIQSDVGESALTMLHSPEPPSREMTLISLVNDIQLIRNRFILILDDFHVIEAQEIHQAVAFLLENLPPQIHLVIASRVEPSLPLPRIRARGELNELHSQDLRFAPDEVATFLNQIMELNLTAEDIAALEARTEGWIAGLQLAALSVQGREDPSAFITTFSGGHRYVLDYLAEEVLLRQSPAIQSFLLQTSILDRITPELCDTITGQDNSQTILEALESANLFLIPLDEERQWYRYHHLFADFLHSRLQREDANLIIELHRRAAKWHEQNYLLADAVNHALAARDFEWAADLVEKTAEAMWIHGEIATLCDWLETLPNELMLTRPRLCLFHAWALFFSTNQPDAANARLQDAEYALVQTIIEPHIGTTLFGELMLAQREQTEIFGMMAAIRAAFAARQEDIAGTIELSRSALQYLPNENLIWRGATTLGLGVAYGLLGDVTAAIRTLAETTAISQSAGNSFVAVIATYNLARMQVLQSHLRQAAHTYEQALALADRSRLGLPIVGMVYVGLGYLLCEWNDLDEAVENLIKGIELCKHVGNIEAPLSGYTNLARVKFAQGDIDGALQTIQQAELLAQQANLSRGIARLEAYRARLWLNQGNLLAASHWGQTCGLTIDDEPDYPHEYEYLTLARVLLANGKTLDARRLLNQLLANAQSVGRIRSVIDILIVMALSFYVEGDIDTSLGKITRALRLAEPENYIRLFVDEGEPMATLLKHAASRGITPGYVNRLLKTFNHIAKNGPVNNQPLITPLSERELEVLELIDSGLSNREIADQLVVAMSTIKTHVKSIYRKLSVNNRAEVIARAHDLSLI